MNGEKWDVILKNDFEHLSHKVLVLSLPPRTRTSSYYNNNNNNSSGNVNSVSSYTTYLDCKYMFSLLARHVMSTWSLSFFLSFLFWLSISVFLFFLFSFFNNQNKLFVYSLTGIYTVLIWKNRPYADREILVGDRSSGCLAGYMQILLVQFIN
jgi:hypothetical protein